MTQFAAFLPVSLPLCPPNYQLPMAVLDIRQWDSFLGGYFATTDCGPCSIAQWSLLAFDQVFGEVV